MIGCAAWILNVELAQNYVTLRTLLHRLFNLWTQNIIISIRIRATEPLTDLLRLTISIMRELF